VVNVHWLPEQVEAAVAARKDIETVISDEREELLETGGALAKAYGLLGKEPVYILNTDALWGPLTPKPLNDLAAAYDPARMDEMLLLANRRRCLGFGGAGDFFLGETGALTRRGAAPHTPWAYAGVRIANPKMFEGLPVEKFSANRIWDPMLAEGRLHGLPLDAFWLHGVPSYAVLPHPVRHLPEAEAASLIGAGRWGRRRSGVEKLRRELTHMLWSLKRYWFNLRYRAPQFSGP
jgi:MurNAc alpha-1-phosphate uridylyltransferase